MLTKYLQSVKWIAASPHQLNLEWDNGLVCLTWYKRRSSLLLIWYCFLSLIYWPSLRPNCLLVSTGPRRKWYTVFSHWLVSDLYIGLVALFFFYIRNALTYLFYCVLLVMVLNVLDLIKLWWNRLIFLWNIRVLLHHTILTCIYRNFWEDYTLCIPRRQLIYYKAPCHICL